MSADFQATTTNDASDNNDLVSEKSEDNSVSLNTDTCKCFFNCNGLLLICNSSHLYETNIALV